MSRASSLSRFEVVAETITPPINHGLDIEVGLLFVEIDDAGELYRLE